MVAVKKLCTCMCTLCASNLGLCDSICTISRQTAFHPSKPDCTLPLSSIHANLMKSLKISCGSFGLNIKELFYSIVQRTSR